MTELVAFPWLLALSIGAILIILIGSPRLVSQLLLRRLLLIPLLWMFIHQLATTFSAEHSVETAALAMGGTALLVIPMFLGRGVLDAIIGNFIYDIIRSVIRLLFFVPMALLGWGLRHTADMWRQLRHH